MLCYCTEQYHCVKFYCFGNLPWFISLNLPWTALNLIMSYVHSIYNLLNVLFTHMFSLNVLFIHMFSLKSIILNVSAHIIHFPCLLYDVRLQTILDWLMLWMCTHYVSQYGFPVELYSFTGLVKTIPLFLTGLRDGCSFLYDTVISMNIKCLGAPCVAYTNLFAV